MKNLLKTVGVFVLGCILMTSCESDDTNTPALNDQSLVGTWKYTKFQEATNGVWEEEAPYEHNAPQCGEDHIDFIADHTFKDSWYVSAPVCTEEWDNGIWSISGNTITMNFGDGNEDFRVVAFDGSTLVIEYQEVYDGDVYTYRGIMSKVSN